MRVGIGYDVHRLEPGRRLVLGGVEIPAECGLTGHSDADVLVHALMDALLGAAGLPDIGSFFPDSDSRYKDASSMVLLQEVAAILAAHGLSAGNVDITLIAERPRIAPRAGEMKHLLGEAIGLPPERIGIKATTNEGIGFIGRGEGIAAIAVAMLREQPAVE